MTTVPRLDQRSSTLGLERVLMLVVVTLLLIVAALVVVSDTGDSVGSVRGCWTSATTCAATGHIVTALS
jgi:hypothetical protein